MTKSITELINDYHRKRGTYITPAALSNRVLAAFRSLGIDDVNFTTGWDPKRYSTEMTYGCARRNSEVEKYHPPTDKADRNFDLGYFHLTHDGKFTLDSFRTNPAAARGYGIDQLHAALQQQGLMPSTHIPLSTLMKA